MKQTKYAVRICGATWAANEVGNTTTESMLDAWVGSWHQAMKCAESFSEGWDPHLIPVEDDVFLLADACRYPGTIPSRLFVPLERATSDIPAEVFNTSVVRDPSPILTPGAIVAIVKANLSLVAIIDSSVAMLESPHASWPETARMVARELMNARKEHGK